jgi:hypothetical protein
MIRINFSRLVNQHWMGHVGKGSTNWIWMVLVVDCTGVCARCRDFSSESSSITVGDWIDWNFGCRKLRTSEKGRGGVTTYYQTFRMRTRCCASCHLIPHMRNPVRETTKEKQVKNRSSTGIDSTIYLSIKPTNLHNSLNLNDRAY